MNTKGTLKRIFKFITDVISWTCLCILIMIGVCIIWYVISAKIYASRGEKYEPYFSLYTIISPSMEPHIKVYDVILDTRVDNKEDIKVGDVITFISTGNLSNGMTITHRVVEVVKDEYSLRFRTKGDNNENPDGALVESENVLGKTLLRIPALGRVQFLLAKKGMWLIVIMIPALGIIIYDILKLFKVVGLKNKVDDTINDKPLDSEKKAKQENERKEEIKNKLKNDKLLEPEEPLGLPEPQEEEKTRLFDKMFEKTIDDSEQPVKTDEDLFKETTEPTKVEIEPTDVKEDSSKEENNLADLFEKTDDLETDLNEKVEIQDNKVEKKYDFELEDDDISDL